MNDEVETPDPREKFEDAIKQLLEDKEYEGFLSEWIIVTTQSHIHEDGSSGTSYSVFISEHAPIHSVAGMLRYATVHNDRHMLGPLGD